MKLPRVSFSILLLASLSLGLVIPGLDRAPKQIIPGFMILVIFFSCFRLTFEEMGHVSVPRALLFWSLRFLLLPLVARYLTMPLGQTLSLAVFLVTLLPAGVASPALCVIYKGNASLALILVVWSSILAPLIIPLSFGLLGFAGVGVDPWKLFRTLCVLLILPLLLHFPFRLNRRMNEGMSELGDLLLKPLIFVMMLFVMAQQRQYVMATTSVLPKLLFTATMLYLIFYGAGWFLNWRERRENRIAYALSSGFNNNVLGVVIATMHFEGEVATFAVITLLSGVLGLMLCGRWFKSEKSPTKD